MRALANLSIKTKLLCGFCGMLAIFACAMWVSYAGNASIGGSFALFAQRVSDGDAVDLIDRRFLELRGTLRNFVFIGDKRDADKAVETPANCAPASIAPWLSFAIRHVTPV